MSARVVVSDRRLGWLLVLASIAAALATQVAEPVGVPLYDGMVIVEPYRYLHPSGDQAGQPTSFSSTPTLSDGVTPDIAAATTEQPPQAQLIAQEDAFEVSPGMSGLQVSISPIEAPPPPPGMIVASNVYRISVADQTGRQLSVKPCGPCLTLFLRASDGVEVATIKRFADGVWHDIATEHAGMVGMYQVNPTVLGDFAVIAEPPPDEGIDLALLVGVGAAALIVVGGVLLYLRVPPAAKAGVGRPSGRVPAKRRKSRRPPPGRTE